MSVAGMRRFFLPVLFAAALAFIHINIGPNVIPLKRVFFPHQQFVVSLEEFILPAGPSRNQKGKR